MGLYGNRGNDPLWNAARTTNLEAYHLQQEAEDCRSPKKRRAAYIVMALMVVFIASIVILFLVS